MFGRKPEPEIKYTIVELDKRLQLAETEESLSAVRTLADHPGFQWLLTKLRIQAARLQSELVSKRHRRIRDVEFLQSGIQWCGWLQQQIDLNRERYRQMRPATSQEVMHFQDIESVIELVGKTQPQDE